MPKNVKKSAQNLSQEECWNAYYNGLPEGIALSDRVTKTMSFFGQKAESLYREYGGPTPDTLAKILGNKDVSQSSLKKLESGLRKYFKSLKMPAHLYRAITFWVKEGKKVKLAPKAVPTLYDLPAKRHLWDEVRADTKKLLGNTLRGYTEKKFLAMDPFLLRDRLKAAGSDSGQRWVDLALQLPGDFPLNNEMAFFRLIAQQQFADAGFGSARRDFYGE